MYSICKLKIITLLDSVSLGLIYPFLSTYIQSLGADHVVVGILSVGYLLCNLISAPEIPLFKNQDKRFNIVAALFATMLTHLTLIVTNNYWHVIFGRYIFSFISNQSQYLCKDLLLQKSEVDKREYMLTILSILSGSGYIIGPITAGYLFDYGFVYIGLLAVLLTLINICIALSISYESNILEDSGKTIPNKMYQNINDTINNCLNSNYKRDWDVMTIKFFHTSCVTIFYGKFSQILKYNYQSSSTAVGYMYAYMNSLIFSSTYFTTFVKQHYAQFSPIMLIENSFIFLSACLFIACYSPVYALYTIMCIPIVFLITFIDSTLTDIFAMRKHESLDRLNEPLKIASALMTPIVFGAFCNIIGHHAVIMFSLIPTTLSLFIIKRYTKNNSSEKDE